MPDTFNKGEEPNKIEGLPVVNLSLEELRAEFEASRAAKEKLQAEKPSDTDPVDEFKAFKFEAKLAQANEAYRHSYVNVLANSPAVVTLNNNNKKYKDIFNGYQGDWKSVIVDQKAIDAVKESVTLEKIALAAANNPKKAETVDTSYVDMALGTNQTGVENKKIENTIDIDLTKTKAEEDASKSKYLNQADEVIARLEERNRLRALKGQELTVNNFTAEQQAAKKEDWLRRNPQNLDIDLSAMDTEAQASPARPSEAATPVVVGSTPEVQASAAGVPVAPKPQEVQAPVAGMPVALKPQVAKLERNIPMENPEEEKRERARLFVNNVAAAPKNMEEVSAVLEKKRNESKANLENMGANWLSKSLEAFKKINPKYKLALGVTLAGASVATGGLTAVVGAGVMKSMSAFSYGTAIYDKMLKRKMDKGQEVNKAAIALNAALLGIGAALATSWIVSEVFSHIDVPEVLDTVKEKFTSVKDGIKQWWSGLGAPAVEAPPVNALDLPASAVVPAPEAGPSPINGYTLDSAPGAALSPESIKILPPYTVGPGDNLTKIIREQVLKTIPGIENLSPLQQNNMIENYLKEASKFKNIAFFDSVNQFANPNVIQPGAKLDLTSIRQSMMSFEFPAFKGETLFEHAKTITGSVATPGAGFGSTIVSTSSPGVAEPYITAASSAPLSTVEPYATAASSAPFSNVEPYSTAASSAPFSNVEPYATAASSAPFSDAESYLTSTSQAPLEGVVRDANGNAIRTGSGGVLRSGGGGIGGRQ